jgi:hypothetical protein
MKLQEIFDQLTYGELSQLAIGGSEVGVIAESDYPRIVAHINLGLNALYRRFQLKTGKTSVVLVPDQEYYTLMETDLLKVETIKALNDAYFTLNDSNDPYSIHTITMKKLMVPLEVVNQDPDLPDDLKVSTLDITYRAAHPKINIGLGYFDPERVDVELPDSHLEALLYFIASRVHNPVGMTNEFHTGNNYAAKYELACQALEQQNLHIDQQPTNTRMERNGWV